MIECDIKDLITVIWKSEDVVWLVGLMIGRNKKIAVQKNLALDKMPVFQALAGHAVICNNFLAS